MSAPSPWLQTQPRLLATGAFGGPWTLALIVGLLWPATPTCALYLVNVSSSTSIEDLGGLPPSTMRRCAPASHDVLWARLNVAAARLSLRGSNNDDDEVSRTDVSIVSDYESSPTDESLSTIPQTVMTSKSSRHRRRRRGKSRSWRRRGRPASRGGRRRSAPTSWSCRLQKRWKRMRSGVFPAYVQTGSCRTQPTCMLGMYACQPRRYLIKVLRRVSGQGADDGCRPVPVVGPDVVYEEAWSLVDVPVIVGCECSRRRRSGTHHYRLADST